MIYDVNGNIIDVGGASAIESLYEVELHFQRGAFAADGSFENDSTSFCNIPHTITEVDYIDVQDTYNASLLMFDGDTYLGKVRPDMTLDKVSGNWAIFNGKLNVRELMKKFSANGFRITIATGSSIPDYATAYNGNYCKFYSCKEPTNCIDKKIQIENGSFSNSNSGSFYFSFSTTRIRCANLIKVTAGDVIEVNTDKGKYLCSYTAWDGLPGVGTRKTVDTVIQDKTQLRSAFDGYYLVLFSLASNSSATILTSDFTGGITLHKYSEGINVIDNNTELLKYAIGSQRNFTNTWLNNVPANNLASFVHISDVHGDKASFDHAYEVAKYINADAFINSGDTVYYYSSDSIDFVTSAVADKKIDYLMCMGNHDGFLYTAEQQNAKFIAPFATNYGYQFPDGVSNPTYYYKDYANRQLRILVVNQFEYDGRTSTTDTRMCFTQNQVDFIVGTLASTPQNYGVVIVMHTIEKTAVKDASYEKFFQEKKISSWESPMTIITEIVDAFMSKTTLSKTFNNPSGSTPTSVTVDADFSSINSGVEFIAYLTGHYHADQIYYVPNATNKQLMLNITTANSWYGMAKSGLMGTNNPYLTEGSDLQRISGTSTQDAMNVYTIDRTNKTVRVVRIGANMPSTMEYIRDYMVIPYAD